MIQRESFEWGVELTTRPFAGSPALDNVAIRAEVKSPQQGRGAVVRITFTGVTIAAPLNLVQSRTWATALNAVIAEAKNVGREMEADGKNAEKNDKKVAGKRVAKKAAKKQAKKRP